MPNRRKNPHRSPTNSRNDPIDEGCHNNDKTMKKTDVECNVSTTCELASTSSAGTPSRVPEPSTGVFHFDNLRAFIDFKTEAALLDRNLDPVLNPTAAETSECKNTKIDGDEEDGNPLDSKSDTPDCSFLFNAPAKGNKPPKMITLTELESALHADVTEDKAHLPYGLTFNSRVRLQRPPGLKTGPSDEEATSEQMKVMSLFPNTMEFLMTPSNKRNMPKEALRDAMRSDNPYMPEYKPPHTLRGMRSRNEIPSGRGRAFPRTDNRNNPEGIQSISKRWDPEGA